MNLIFKKKSAADSSIRPAVCCRFCADNINRQRSLKMAAHLQAAVAK
jgi:hypothetical protein